MAGPTAAEAGRQIPQSAALDTAKVTSRRVIRTMLEPTFPGETVALTAVPDLHPHLVCDEEGIPITGQNGRYQFEYRTTILPEPKPIEDHTARPVVVFEEVQKPSSRLSILGRLIPRRA